MATISDRARASEKDKLLLHYSTIYTYTTHRPRHSHGAASLASLLYTPLASPSDLLEIQSVLPIYSLPNTSFEHDILSSKSTGCWLWDNYDDDEHYNQGEQLDYSQLVILVGHQFQAAKTSYDNDGAAGPVAAQRTQYMQQQQY